MDRRAIVGILSARLIAEATVVPSGVVRLMELQEQGWSYVRP
jgi:intracellular sulfur oxidation DsrE/DsrF family protein